MCESSSAFNRCRTRDLQVGFYAYVKATLQLSSASFCTRLSMSAAETNSDRTAAKATAVALDSGRPRLLIVDDQDEVRRTVAELLEDTFRIIGMAEDGERAIELASVLHPDVVVLDICMPVLNGIDAAERLRASGYPTKVVFLSMQDDPEFVSAALATGALGYVLKSTVGTELISAIWKAVEGRRFISPALCWH